MLPPVEKHFIMKTQLLLNFILVLLKALLQCVCFGPHLVVLRTGSWLCAQGSILAELRGPCGWFVWDQIRATYMQGKCPIHCTVALDLKVDDSYDHAFVAINYNSSNSFEKSLVNKMSVWIQNIKCFYWFEFCFWFELTLAALRDHS